MSQRSLNTVGSEGTSPRMTTHEQACHTVYIIIYIKDLLVDMSRKMELHKSAAWGDLAENNKKKHLLQ